MDNKELQQATSQTPLSLQVITKTTDLLHCKHIVDQVRDSGIEVVQMKLASSISLCSEVLGLNLNQGVLRIMVEDMMDVYKHESVEDLIECIKKGRKGFYGTTYRQLNMIVIQEWMSHHLEEKAIARERSLEVKKREELQGSDRLIDIIEAKRQELAKMGNPDQLKGEGLKLYEQKIEAFNKLKDQLKENTKSFHDQMKANSKRRVKEDDKFSKIKADRLVKRGEIELSQWKNLLPEFNPKDLLSLSETHDDLEVKKLAKQEIVRRRNLNQSAKVGNTQHQRKG